ncbi:MAG TPA: bifunctional 4-hydroxy-2-oxoglutarate aldolase/2-dehydro-3-deoxy-phosphogluconate aldolase [Bryobacteraceae bacterium]|nr:bifunctional 4-hydroxy-2-oxoglutarate aldolase/2-dehydro-3-deoxy-phosphogluconate aldolase [Bryobacteraceae bacterium]
MIQAALDRIRLERMIPVVRAPSLKLALSAAQALCDGGISVIEIAMTVPGAVEVICELARSASLLIGAGTVLDVAAARNCVQAGAQFLVSPGLDLPTLKFARDAHILMLPGALTPADLLTAWKHGAALAKVFPCGNLGGPSYLRSLKAALPPMELVPTGGVSLANASQFLAAGALAVGVGGELVSARALANGDLAAISASARQFKSALAL